MFPGVIYPNLVLGWRVVRTWPSLARAWSKPTMDYMEVWPVERTGLYPDKNWHDAYVSSTSKFVDHATIFKSYDEAVKVMQEVAPRWEGAVFGVEPVVGG